MAKQSNDPEFYKLPDPYANPILLADFYHGTHSMMMCNNDWGTAHIYNRSAPMILYGFNWHVCNVLSRKITTAMIDEAETCWANGGLPLTAFPRTMWEKVVEDYQGFLPIEINALPDGSMVPKGTPFAQITNRGKGMEELIYWLEPVLLWASFPSACATRAFKMRRYLERKKYPLTKYHDFGLRGARSGESAMWAGTAWALYLPGSDNMLAYRVTPTLRSIPAQAHKVVQQWNNELDCMLHTIDSCVQHGIKAVSILIDTYNADYFIAHYASIIAKYATKRGVMPIFRPDSGETIEQVIELFKIMQAYGIADRVGFIVGEKMDFEKSVSLDSMLAEHGVNPVQVAWGIGGGFYNDLNRDTLGWSMKCAYSNDAPRMKFSNDPIKQSIPGRLALHWVDGELQAQYYYPDGTHVYSKGEYGMEHRAPRLGEYHTVYLWSDCIVADMPTIMKQPWEEIHGRAMTAYHLHKNKFDEAEILLTPDVKEQIAHMRAVNSNKLPN